MSLHRPLGMGDGDVQMPSLHPSLRGGKGRLPPRPLGDGKAQGEPEGGRAWGGYSHVPPIGGFSSGL